MRFPMGLLVADCPRCGAKQITFDVLAQWHCFTRFEWQNWFEIFCVCRSCKRSTVFLVGLEDIGSRDIFYQSQGIVSFPGDVSPVFEIERFISLRDNVSITPPEHVTGDIKNAFIEGAACLSIECFNAAATMFRLCVDLATLLLLAASSDNTKPKPHDMLGRRLTWMFNNKILPSELQGLAACIKEDGNDGAHIGNLTKADADDLVDFTTRLLDRLISEPERLKLAEKRRLSRRSSKD
jgi:Domain of unknown function (DUF4145)